MLWRLLGALALCLAMASSLAAQTGLSWQNCVPDSPIGFTTLTLTPDPPPTPAPLALTASVDSTLGRVTDVHGYVMFGPLPFFFDSDPLSLDVDDGFVFLPGAISMKRPVPPGLYEAVTSLCGSLEPYKLPCKEPIKANSYGTPRAGIPFFFGDGASLDTIVTIGYTKVDITPTNLKRGSVALSFNGMLGFPLPPTTTYSPPTPPGPPPQEDYSAQVELLNAKGGILGCLGLTLGINFVQCAVNVAAHPQFLLPTGQMTPVAVVLTTSQGCASGECAIASVSSNDPAASDAVASGDAVITGAFNVNLSAQSGRVYTVTLKCVDGYGAPSKKSVSVIVR